MKLYQILEQLSENSPHKNKIKSHARFKDDGYMTWKKAPAHGVAHLSRTQKTSTISWDSHARPHQKKLHSWIPRCTQAKDLDSNVMNIKICAKPTETYRLSIERLATPTQYFTDSWKKPCISRICTKLDPDNLKASLDKCDLSEGDTNSKKLNEAS